MDTSISPSPSSISTPTSGLQPKPGFKVAKFLDFSEPGGISFKYLPTSPKPKRKRSKRKSSKSSQRKDFELYLRRGKQEDAERLDKLRNDLQESIERTVRVQLAFTKELNKFALSSNRVKKIIKAVGEVPFHCDLQRKIVGDGVTTILKSENEQLKRQRHEELEREREYQKSACFNCYVPSESEN
jgi:hypothetical protein